MFILDNVLNAAQCKFFETAIAARFKEFQEQNPDAPTGDSLVSKSFSAYALPETEDLLLYLTDNVSNLLGRPLAPTYSYSRIYFPGAVMEPHVDRPACEVSMSLRIGGDEWPIWFQLEKPTPITLDVGSAVLYKGLETTHWREEYTGTGCTQVFLHWVDASGPHADWKFDRRPTIGAKESEKSYWGKS